jgi:hypothetical protein
MNTQVKRLTINLLSKDKDALQELADIVGEPLSVLVRSILRGELQKQRFRQSRSYLDVVHQTPVPENESREVRL